MLFPVVMVAEAHMSMCIQDISSFRTHSYVFTHILFHKTSKSVLQFMAHEALKDLWHNKTTFISKSLSVFYERVTHYVMLNSYENR